MKLLVLVTVTALLLPLPALAEVTVCEGDRCTVVSSTGSREMSPQEVRAKQRSEASLHLSNVDCEISDDPRACRQIIADATKLFR